MLPPGPSLSPRRQVLAWLFRPEAVMERAQRECGDVFTLQLPLGPIVAVADPALIKEVFTGDSDVLRAGEGNAPLEPVVGPDSLLLLDGARHLRRRRLVLPPFHGDRLKAYSSTMADITAADLATWPHDEPFPVEPRLRAITLAIILRVVFGIEDSQRAATLERLIPQLIPDGAVSSLLLLPALRRDLGPRSPWRRFLQARAAIDAILFDEIAHRRAETEHGDDILSMLVQARDEDGAPLTDHELRDELITLLTAGHETTASALSWTFALLHHRPDLAEAARHDDALLDAIVTETLRLKPPLSLAVRRTTQPLQLGSHTLPAGTRVGPCLYLANRHPATYGPDAGAFRPERFLDTTNKPDTYSWVPFGGGIRRCVGAAFAQLEMRTVLRAALDTYNITPAPPRGRAERTRRRAIVLTPSAGGRTIVSPRRAPAPAAPRAAAASSARP
ncbi:cytochrome P450 [Conexibacter woesei]|uniref:cytochrome P450 n=1 Tax=Conexibacter woesei TaxID=191495 RepID=UPI0006849E3E|nr:cytochrome P450 [Conexibacter woesei]